MSNHAERGRSYVTGAEIGKVIQKVKFDVRRSEKKQRFQDAVRKQLVIFGKMVDLNAENCGCLPA